MMYLLYFSDVSPVTDNIPKMSQTTFAKIAESKLRHFSVQQPWTQLWLIIFISLIDLPERHKTAVSSI